MNRRVASLALLAILIAPVPVLLSVTDAASQAGGTTIVAGERIGPVFLGMAERDLLSALGSPSRTHETIGYSGPRQTPFVFGKDHYYGAERLGGHVWEIGVSSIPAPEVKSIKTTSADYATEHGIRVGDSGVSVVEAYGREYESNYLSGPLAGGVQLTYRHLGIGFILTSDNRVVAIQVWPRY